MTENDQMGKAIRLEVPDLVDIVDQGLLEPTCREWVRYPHPLRERRRRAGLY
jgi:hypothetical protein